MPYKTTDIKRSIRPMIVDPTPITSVGTGRKRTSLNIRMAQTPKEIPIIIKKNPGTPRYFNGCLIAMDSIKDVTTSPV